jgi:hypothetical protein
MQNSLKALSNEVKELVEQISSMPAWSDFSSDNDEDRRQVIDILQTIARAPAERIRQAMEAYIEQTARAEAGYDVSAMSRLYILNRFVFNVPDKAELGRPRFGSFFGIPSEGNTVNELWPLSKGVDGRLVLDGDFGGYFGESYLAVQEFDHFNNEYGRRSVAPNVGTAVGEPSR